MCRSKWNTYRLVGYTHDVGCDHHQVRYVKNDGWYHRIIHSNGMHESYGPVSEIDRDKGETKFAQARERMKTLK